MSGSITAIIPAYNEQNRIQKTIEALIDLSRINQIIVVDDGSKDGTYEILKQFSGIEVIKNKKNSGKGCAIKKALPHSKSDYVLLIDADLEESAKEADKMLAALEAHENIMVIGALPAPRIKGGAGIVKTLSREGLYFLTAQDVAVVLSGQRAMPLSFISALELPDHFGLEFKLTLEAIRSGIPIVEVPVEMRHRETANDFSGFWHRGRQCADIMRVLRNEYHNLKH